MESIENNKKLKKEINKKGTPNKKRDKTKKESTSTPKKKKKILLGNKKDKTLTPRKPSTYYRDVLVYKTFLSYFLPNLEKKYFDKPRGEII